MNRRKFLTYVGCTCCSLALNSCATAPITDRKQLKLIPEAKLNAQAAQIFEKIKRRLWLSEKILETETGGKIFKKIREGLIYSTLFHSNFVSKIGALHSLLFHAHFISI